MNSTDPLQDFLNWYLRLSGPIAFCPRLGAVHKVEDVTSVLMARNGQFQVQMFIVPPNYVIPEHAHPNVDSFEVYVGGQIRFSKHGKWCSSESETNAQDQHGLCGLRGVTIRVKPDDVHGGAFGPAGGCFLSVQHWLNGVPPTCVANDYIGAVMGPDHMRKVTTGEPTLKPALSVRDAASLEADPITWGAS